ncbi:MAG TPA: ester cyclase [Bryobacteraceae bacterium]
MTPVERFFEEVCNGRKLAVADEIFTADHRYHDSASTWVGVGPEGQKQLISGYQRAFPDAHWTVEETLTAGDRVITRWTGTGAHRGDLMGIAPTGRTVEVTGIWMHRIAGGKIAESWNCWDTLGMMQQLGVAPVVQAARG